MIRLEGILIILSVICLNACDSGPDLAIDYRTRFVGTYTGREICYFGYNYATPISDTLISVEVSLSENPNNLLVNNDEMTIDSSGSCLYPSCCGYRWYAQRFWADSLFVYKNTGSLGYPTECSFRGQRQ
jgi:hypothetical protein